MDASVEDLLRQVVENGGRVQQAAAKTLYMRFTTPFLRFLTARRFHFSLDQAEEINQDVFLKIFSNAERILERCAGKADSHYQNYFFRILNNRAVDVLRHEGQAPPIERMELPDDDEQDRTMEFADETNPNPDHQLCVQQVFEQFSEQYPDCARAITLRAEGYDDAEIAQALDRNSNAIRQYVYECRQRLRKLIEDNCSDALIPARSK